ncbi:MAG: hypothetical protein RLZZ383_305 [Pseudomonadota bacterium]
MTPFEAWLVAEGLGLDEPRVQRALTHRSWAQTKGAAAHNEVDELLGDAVVSLVVTRLLIAAFPEASEGSLTELRQAIVSDRALARAGLAWGLGDALLVASDRLRVEVSVVGSAVEAVFAALLETRGLDGAMRLGAALFGATIEELKGRGAAERPAWNRLQEHLERDLRRAPPTVVWKQEQPDGRWRAGIDAAGRGFEGEGPTLKDARRAAAELALAALVADPPESERDADPAVGDDPVSRLNTHAQRAGGASPRFEDAAVGDAWTTTLTYDDASFPGQGRSKSAARRDAASRAVGYLERTGRLR